MTICLKDSEAGCEILNTLEIQDSPCVKCFYSTFRCAMALLHSRIRRVFYGCSDTVMGAIGSRFKIHTQAGLNHHFEVFSGVLEDECKSLFDSSLLKS